MYSLVVRNLKSVIAAGGLGTRLQNFRGNQSTKILLEVADGVIFNVNPVTVVSEVLDVEKVSVF